MLATPGIAAIVNLTQYPVGHYLNASLGGPFTYCRHGGWPECELQSAFLCAREQKDAQAMFDLGECVNDALGFSEDPATFPDYDGATSDLVPACAKKLGLDEAALFRCAREQGPTLQNAAAGEGAKRGIRFAPTLFIDGKQQTATKITLRQICDAYTGPKPKACSGAEEEPVEAVANEPAKRCPVS